MTKITVASVATVPILLVATACASDIAAVCSSDWDCSLNGDCVDGNCRCDAAFQGPRCAQLALVPMARKDVEGGTGYRRGRSTTSWGGGPPLRDASGRYHLYLSELANNCTLQSWVPNSRVNHVVADAPQGPYEFHSTVFETFHHNPTVVKNPRPSHREGEEASAAEDAYLMFLIGGAMAPSAPGNCSSGRSDTRHLESNILVSSAPSPEGPWSEPIGPLLARGSESEWDFIVTNPAPVVLANGTVLLYYRGTPKYFARASADDSGLAPAAQGPHAPRDLVESVGLAIAPHWRGPYAKRFSRPILAVMNEDPFVWRDKRGFKMLTHGRDDWQNTHLAYSRDGLTWSNGSEIATGPNVTLAGGGVAPFTNRERPHVFFNESTGEPALLFNGVCPGQKYGYGYTIAQFFRQSDA